MKNLILLIAFLLAVSVYLQAQENVPTKHESSHEHHKTELGLANLMVYMGDDANFSYGLHLHGVRNLGESRFGIGLGYEHIFDIHGHNTLGVVGSVRATDHLSFNVTPGVAFESLNSGDARFAMHFEATYEFELGNFHLGPLVEYAFDASDYHISLGLHLGMGF